MKYFIALCTVLFLALTLPLASKRPSGGRSAERQGFTAGIIRMYCLDPDHSIVKGPQIHFGNNPFNLEYTGFEWAEGVAARAVGGEDCGSSVEVIGKTVSILFSAAAILLVAWAAFLLALRAGVAEPSARLSAAISAFLLASCELWLRYSTYTMVENRTLFFALLGLIGCWKITETKRLSPLWFSLTALGWAMAGMHKPQGYAFFAAFWCAFEFLRWLETRKKPNTNAIAAFAVGTAAMVAWLFWNSKLDPTSDLPWILHTGPRATHWYFGDWSERFRLHFYTSNFLKSLQQTGVLVALPALLCGALFLRSSIRTPLRQLARVVIPHLVATLAFVFVFWNVFIVHEYYALPFDVARALCTGVVLGVLCEHLFTTESKTLSAISRNAVALAAALVVTGVCANAYLTNIPRYLDYAERIEDPRAPDYLQGWNINVFPKKNPFVVMTVRSRGSELLYLYMAHAHGFIWCTQNPVHAPRKYWKDEGIKYVAWGEPSKDPKKPGLYEWKVRTIDEELADARKRGWSSDINDHWAGHTMAEWSAIASRGGYDPCLDPKDFDPRQWKEKK